MIKILFLTAILLGFSLVVAASPSAYVALVHDYEIGPVLQQFFPDAKLLEVGDYPYQTVSLEEMIYFFFLGRAVRKDGRKYSHTQEGGKSSDPGHVFDAEQVLVMGWIEISAVNDGEQ